MRLLYENCCNKLYELIFWKFAFCYVMVKWSFLLLIKIQKKRKLCKKSYFHMGCTSKINSIICKKMIQMLIICDVYLTQRKSVNLKQELDQSPEKFYKLNLETLFQFVNAPTKRKFWTAVVNIFRKWNKNTSCNFPQRQLRFTAVSPE